MSGPEGVNQGDRVMRVVALSLSILLAAIAVTASATQPAAQENLGTVLKGWEKAMTDLKSFVAEAERSTLDKSLNTKDDHKGYAMFVKATGKDENSRARLELAKVTKTSVFEKYICTGTFLYEYVPATTTIRIHDMPKNKQGGMQESFLSFLFGMSAEEAQKRYDMQLVVGKTPDKFYHYIRVLPKTAHDKSDFIEARLSLLRTNNLPAQIWYLQPNKNEITWNFTKMQLNVQIPLTYFQPEDLKGWKTERVQPKSLK
jgi:TIGR03009 family protein